MLDPVTLEEVLDHIHNWFERDVIPVQDCTVVDGELPESVTDNIPTGAWYVIRGSILNDGMHLNPCNDMADETFSGTVTVCAVPKTLLAVAERVDDWIRDRAVAASKAAQSPYKSESFDGYTYTVRDDLTSAGASSSNGGLRGWQAEFSSDLNPYRRLP